MRVTLSAYFILKIVLFGIKGVLSQVELFKLKYTPGGLRLVESVHKHVMYYL